MKKFKRIKSDILSKVPVDYYQNGYKHNILQRFWHLGKLNAIFALIGTKPIKTLDIGCASGWFLSSLKKKIKYGDYFGIDAYRSAIDFGTKLYPDLNLVNADAHKIPFNNNTFDLIICAEVLEHVKSPDIVLKEIRRLLKEKGKAIIEMDTGNWLFRFVWNWWNNRRDSVWKDAHLHIFNTSKLENEIRKAGFLIENKIIFNMSMAVVFLITKRQEKHG